jgi:hypothetical protein
MPLVYQFKLHLKLSINGGFVHPGRRTICTGTIEQIGQILGNYWTTTFIAVLQEHWE